MLKSTVNLNVRVEPQLAERLEAYLVKAGQSKTAVVSEAVDQYLKKQKEDKK